MEVFNITCCSKTVQVFSSVWISPLGGECLKAVCFLTQSWLSSSRIQKGAYLHAWVRPCHFLDIRFDREACLRNQETQEKKWLTTHEYFISLICGMPGSTDCNHFWQFRKPVQNYYCTHSFMFSSFGYIHNGVKLRVFKMQPLHIDQRCLTVSRAIINYRNCYMNKTKRILPNFFANIFRNRVGSSWNVYEAIKMWY